jgi:hypothetical protein
LSREYGRFEELAELRSLIDSEPERMGILESELAKFWRMQEIKIRQRYRDREILEGNTDTTYFHVVANQRSKKKRIDHLEGPSGHVHEQRFL